MESPYGLSIISDKTNVSTLSDKFIVRSKRETSLLYSENSKKRRWFCCPKKMKHKGKNNLKPIDKNKKLWDREYWKSPPKKPIVLTYKDLSKPEWQNEMLRRFIVLFQKYKFSWIEKILEFLPNSIIAFDFDLYLNQYNSLPAPKIIYEKRNQSILMDYSVLNLQNAKNHKIQKLKFSPQKMKNGYNKENYIINMDKSYIGDRRRANSNMSQLYVMNYESYSDRVTTLSKESQMSLNMKDLKLENYEIEDQNFLKTNNKMPFNDSDKNFKLFLEDSLRSVDQGTVHTYIHQDSYSREASPQNVNLKDQLRIKKIEKCLKIFREMQKDKANFFYKLEKRVIQYLYLDFMWVKKFKSTKNDNRIKVVLESLFFNIMLLSQELSHGLFQMFKSKKMLDDYDSGDITKSEVFLTSIVGFIFSKPLIIPKNNWEAGLRDSGELTLHNLVMPMIIEEHSRAIEQFTLGLELFITKTIKISDLSPFLSLDQFTVEAIKNHKNTGNKLPEFINFIESKAKYNSILNLRPKEKKIKSEEENIFIPEESFGMSLKALKKIPKQKSPYFKLFYFLKVIRSIPLDISNFYEKLGYDICFIVTAEELFPILINLLSCAKFYNLLPELILTSTFMTENMSSGEVGHCLNTFYAAHEYIKLQYFSKENGKN